MREFKSLFKSFKFTVLVLIFTSLCSFAKDNVITVAGSTTILPVSEKWAKVFKNKTGVTINVHGGGSTGGIKATRLGTADIGASSRELSEGEKKSLKEIVIGKDALAVIVNKSNSIESITIDDLRKIFAGGIKNWKELNGEDKPIQVVNRESGSGTRDLFVDAVMKAELADKTQKIIPMALTSIVNNANAEVKESVKLIPGSIGYVSVGFTDETVKILKINSVFPTDENILSGNYSLVRNLYYLVKDEGANNKQVSRFISYILSKEGQELILEEGFFPILSSTN